MKIVGELQAESDAVQLLAAARMFVENGRQIPSHVVTRLCELRRYWKGDVPAAIVEAARRLRVPDKKPRKNRKQTS